jgi:hypothetical protein
VDDVGSFVDDKSDKVLDNDFITLDGIDPLGSNRSIISMMEPDYCGGIYSGEEDAFFSDYNYRIYAQGSKLALDFKPKEPAKDGDASESDEGLDNTRKVWSDEASQEALKAIEGKIDKAPKGTKLSVHFDIFGYAKDASIDTLEPEINNLKGKYPDINELNIDYKGQYEKLNDPDEVMNDLGETMIRFRNRKFLEKKEK